MLTCNHFIKQYKVKIQLQQKGMAKNTIQIQQTGTFSFSNVIYINGT